MQGEPWGSLYRPGVGATQGMIKRLLGFSSAWYGEVYGGYMGLEWVCFGSSRGSRQGFGLGVTVLRLRLRPEVSGLQGLRA